MGSTTLPVAGLDTVWGALRCDADGATEREAGQLGAYLGEAATRAE
jgi:hypothetical protein